MPRTPPPRSPDLSVPLNAFFGRTDELASLDRLLRGPRRLITLTGPAGVGKTRLALELVRRWSEAGVQEGQEGQQSSPAAWFCDLSEAMTVEDICAAVVHALDIQGAAASGDEAVKRVGRHLAGLTGPGDSDDPDDSRGPLVVLDNFEQVAGEAAATVGAFLRAAPKVRFVVTSRVRLRLEGEAVVALEPLSHEAATALWEDRVDLVRPGYAVAADEADVLHDVLEGLDWLPLAIELAAARMHVMGLREVRDRLSERLELLSAGPTDVPGRQRSLEAALSWSWRQLTAAERGALGQCTCFRAGFDVAAATAVIDLSCFEGAPPVLDVVQSLVEQSWLSVRDSPGPATGRRLGLLRSIHDFVLARLADSAAGEIRRDAGATARHARHFVGIAEGWMRGWEGREDDRALGRLGLERENLLAAAEGALREPDADPTVALRAALVLQPVVSAWGPIRPQLDLVERCLREAVEAAPGDAPVEARLEARALLVRGRLRMTFSGAMAAEVDWQRALELAAEAKDPELEGRARHGVATAAHVRGELPEAREHYERSLELLRPEGNRRALGRLLLDLGMLHEEMGDLDEALDRVGEAHRAAGEARDDLAGAVLASRGNVHLEMGHLALAQESLFGALTICRAEGFRLLEGQVLGDLAVTTLLRGEPRPSCAQLGVALAILEEVGDRRLVCVFSGYLAVAHHAAGNLEAAVERYDWAHRAAVKLGFRRYEGIFAALGAMAYADQGRLDEAARRLDISVQSRGDRSDPVIDGVVELTRGQVALGEARTAARSGLSSEAQTRFRAAQAHAGPRAGARSRDFALAQMLFVRASETTAAVIGAPELAEEVRVRLTVDGEGHWFRIGAEAVTDLGRRSAVRRLLVALARHHVASPGVPLSAEALTAAVWSGEKMSPKSAKNRLHVALSNLRKAGLGPLLVTGAGGYFFDPRVDVHIAATAE